MAVQLHPLCGRMVGAGIFERADLLYTVDGLDHEFLLELIEIHHALYKEKLSVFDLLGICFEFFRQQPEFESYTVSVIGQGSGEDDFSVPRLVALHAEHLAAHHDFMRIFSERSDRRRVLEDALSENDVGIFRDEGFLLLVLLLRCIGELLRRFLFLLLLSSPVPLNHVGYFAPYLFVICAEQLLHIIRYDLAVDAHIGQSGTLAEDFLKIIEKVLLSLTRYHAVGNSRIYQAVFTKIKSRAGEDLIEKRAYLHEFLIHAGPVHAIEILRRILG